MAESLQFSIGADTKAFNDGISGMIAGLAGLAAAFISVRAVIESFSDAIDLGGRLHDLSTRTGETAGNLAILERAFENTGVGAEKVGSAITKMQKNIADAVDGSAAMRQAFQELGIALVDLQGKTPIQQMEMIAKALSAITNDSQRAQLAVQVFGKAGGDLIPVLRNFGVEIDLAKAQLGSLPSIMDASAAGFDSIGDSISAIKNKATELAAGFLSTLVPAINKMLNSLSMMDAAGFGQGLSELLLGAFQSPLKTIELWGNSMRYVSQLFINEMLNGIDYIGRILGLSLTGVLSSTTEAFYKYLEPLWTVAKIISPQLGLLEFGLDDIARMAEETRDKIFKAFSEAVSQTAYIRKDWTGAQDSAERIKELTAEIREDGKQFAESFDESNQTSKEMLRDISDFKFPTIANDQTGAPFFPTIANDQTGLPIPRKEETTGGTITARTAEQIQADINRQLSLIAGASSTQLIGQSAAASRALEDQKKLDQMIALGKGDTAEAITLQKSIQRHVDQAAGLSLTSADQYAASSWAWQEYLKEGQTLSLDKLTDLAEQDIMRRKREEDQLTKAQQAEAAKAEAAGAGGAAGKAPPVSLSSIVNSIQMILQKIEPKIPTHVMS